MINQNNKGTENTKYKGSRLTKDEYRKTTHVSFYYSSSQPAIYISHYWHRVVGEQCLSLYNYRGDQYGMEKPAKAKVVNRKG